MRKVALILPGISSGGSERVMIELVWYLSVRNDIEVSLISLTKGEIFFKLPQNINYLEPGFYHRNYNRFVFTLKTFLFLRNKLKEINPFSLISFGGKYNSFVLLASLGLKINTFISDRSRPSISYGRFLDLINKVLYLKANGIIAQTNRAKDTHLSILQHSNIRVIGNPIRSIQGTNFKRENIILNVGRFIKSKNQHLLLRYFSEIENKNWRLVFVGDGEELNNVKIKAIELGLNNKVDFPGIVKNINEYYLRSKIFAFTSSSEGFPNALGEAMSAGCACISFDCEAGPSDLIDDGKNGYLIERMNHNDYKEKLQRLMTDEKLRLEFVMKAKVKIEEFSIEKIGKKYVDFIMSRNFRF